MITIKRAALGAAGVCLMLLAGCGKQPMTSYDAEKSRIRDALPKSVACSESMYGAGKIMSCKANAFDVALVSEQGMSGQEILHVRVNYNQYFSREPISLSVMVKLLSVYDFTELDFETCSNTRSHTKQAKTHVMSCTRNQSKGHDYTVNIAAQTAI